MVALNFVVRARVCDAAFRRRKIYDAYRCASPENRIVFSVGARACQGIGVSEDVVRTMVAPIDIPTLGSLTTRVPTISAILVMRMAHFHVRISDSERSRCE